MYRQEHGRLASVPHGKRIDEHLVAQGNPKFYLPSPPHASRQQALLSQSHDYEDVGINNLVADRELVDKKQKDKVVSNS